VFIKLRQSSTGNLDLLDKGTRPAVIVNTVSRKITKRMTPGKGLPIVYRLAIAQTCDLTEVKGAF
jgi:hypothetical protein